MSKLLTALVQFRDAQATREGVEDFKVLQYKTLQEIARVLPSTFEELAQVKGIGPAKLKKYGEKILKLVQESTNNTIDEIFSVIPEATSEDESSSQTRAIRNLGLRQEKNRDSGQLSQSLVTSGMTEPKYSGLSSIDQSVGLPANDRLSNMEQLNEKGVNSLPTKQVVSVSEYLDYLNLVFQKTADVKIRGEVSGAKKYPQGTYFTLKDKEDESPLGCFLPTFTQKGLGLPLEDGLEVCVEGIPRMVKRSGRFQFTVENMELVGEGALKKLYEILHAKLSAEGLFTRKRALPEYIKKIGVVTSRAGAVIHDFRNNLDKRGFQVYLKDVRVEGASSSGMIVEAVKYFNEVKDAGSGVDVIVVMRGGGSLEDLQAFNDERVVRSIFSSKIPTIVAIGHDRDVPLAQLTADLQVSTPTAAAHAINSSWDGLTRRLPELQSTLVYLFSDRINVVRQKLTLSTRIVSGEMGKIFISFRKYKDACLEQTDKYLHWIKLRKLNLTQSKQQILSAEKNSINASLLKIQGFDKLLTQVNPERQLNLGYAIVRSNGKLVRSKGDVKSGDLLQTQVQDGSIESVVS